VGPHARVPGPLLHLSRRYSGTLGALRRARQRHQRPDAESRRAGEPIDVRGLEDRLLADEKETTLVIGDWTYQGTGWTRDGDQALALAAVGRARVRAVEGGASRQERALGEDEVMAGSEIEVPAVLYRVDGPRLCN
jgi:hypothetical protein